MCESETICILKPATGVIRTEMYEALLFAQVLEDKAKAAGDVAKAQDFASKSDVWELQAEMVKRFAKMVKSLAFFKFTVFLGEAIIIALLLKLVFFP